MFESIAAIDSNIIYTDNIALLEESSWSALSWYVIKPKTPIPNEERHR
jgi:hypothetical protein